MIYEHSADNCIDTDLPRAEKYEIIHESCIFSLLFSILIDPIVFLEPASSRSLLWWDGQQSARVAPASDSFPGCSDYGGRRVRRAGQRRCLRRKARPRTCSLRHRLIEEKTTVQNFLLICINLLSFLSDGTGIASGFNIFFLSCRLCYFLIGTEFGWLK